MMYCTLTFADGEERIQVEQVDRERYSTFNLTEHGIQVVTGVPGILEYIESNRSMPPARDSEDERKFIMIGDRVVRSQLKTDNNIDTLPVRIGSVIPRNGELETPEKTFANVVHRDLDETSVQNYNIDQYTQHYNCWVPFTVQTHSDYPLAFLKLTTLDSKQYRGYRGLSHDSTGLAYHEDQHFFFFDNLQPGDAIVWKSELVYHGAMKYVSRDINVDPEAFVPPQRKSVDIRYHYSTALPCDNKPTQQQE